MVHFVAAAQFAVSAAAQSAQQKPLASAVRSVLIVAGRVMFAAVCKVNNRRQGPRTVKKNWRLVR